MLRIMRRYQKGVMGLMAIIFVSLAMAGFGLDMFRNGSEREAITVNGRSVPHEEYYRELRQTNDRYVQMFGARFSELAKSFNLNLPQQVVDQMINGLLLEEQAENLGLAVGDKELKDFLNKSFEGDTAKYADFLRASGSTAPQFEERARQDLLRQQFSSLLNLVSFASKREAEALLTKEETKVDVEYVEVSADAVKATVPAPDEAALKAYFENNMTDFQIAPTVSYQYFVLAPESVASEVVLTDEDLAFYLSEHEDRFSTSERARLRHIELLFAKDATDEQQKQTRERAEGLLKRARAGEAFEALVMEASDDITTKMLGGDLGWTERKSADADLAEKVFALKGTGVADLVTTPSGFRIVKVEEYQAAKVKDLADVRGEIESILRAQESPAYAMARAQQLFSDLKSGKTTLDAISSSFKGSVSKTGDMLGAEKDPDSKLTGLTAKVLEQGEQQLQLHEIGDLAVFVSVEKYTQPTLPAFDAVREKITSILTQREAQQAARKLAQEVLSKLEKGEVLEAVAETAALPIEKKEGLDRKTELTGALSDPKFAKELFSSPRAGKVVSGVFQGPKGYIVATVSKVTPPEASLIKEKLTTYQEQATASVSNAMTVSVLNHLKSLGKVDFDQSILAN